MNTSRKQTIRFLLVDLDYQLDHTTKKPTIILYGKYPKGQLKIKVKDFLPYFYVKKNSELPFIFQNDPVISQWCKKYEEVKLRRYFWGKEVIKLYKVFGTDPRKIWDIEKMLERLGFEVFESDIPFLKRFLLDTGIKCLNVVEAEVSKTTQKNLTKMIAEAKALDIKLVSRYDIPSADFFYQLKLMSIVIKVSPGEKSTEQLIARRKKRIKAIAVMWGTEQEPETGKLFHLENDTNKAEKEMILRFLAYIEAVSPDILVTFQGDVFDFPYLLSRMKLLGISEKLLSAFQDKRCFYSHRLLSYRFKGRLSFDLALRTWGIHPDSGKKGFYDITFEVLQKRGVPLHESLESIWNRAFVQRDNKKIELFAKHCLFDSKLVYQLYWALGMSGWIETLRITGFPTAESNSCTERVNGEFELLRYLRRKGILLPRKPSKEQIERNRKEREEKPHEGGTVIEPKGLLHTGVIIIDFRSMYPSVMVAENIGGETMRNLFTANDFENILKQFSKETKSSLAIMESELIATRIAKKEEIAALEQLLLETRQAAEKERITKRLKLLNREQNSLKIVANAMYGSHFYIRSRFYSQPLASAIADGARKYLLDIQKKLVIISDEITPCEMVYGDTDSAFIKLLDNQLVSEIYTTKNTERKDKLLEQLIELSEKIITQLNSDLPKPLKLELKDIAYRILFKPKRKKAYSYLSVLTNKLEIKGFEAVRGNWSPIAQKSQRKILEIILTGSEPSVLEKVEGLEELDSRERTADLELCEEFLVALGQKILTIPTKELLPFVITYSPINRHPNLYRTITPGVFAYLDFVKREALNLSNEWLTYDKFPWVITAGTGSKNKRARHPQYTTTIDRKHYIREILLSVRKFGIRTTVKDVLNAGNNELLEFLEEMTNKEERKTTQQGQYEITNPTLLQTNSKEGKKRKLYANVLKGQTRITVFIAGKKKEEN